MHQPKSWDTPPTRRSHRVNRPPGRAAQQPHETAHLGGQICRPYTYIYIYTYRPAIHDRFRYLNWRYSTVWNHILVTFGGIMRYIPWNLYSPYINLYGSYLQFRSLKWPLTRFCVGKDLLTIGVYGGIQVEVDPWKVSYFMILDGELSACSPLQIIDQLDLLLLSNHTHLCEFYFQFAPLFSVICLMSKPQFLACFPYVAGMLRRPPTVGAHKPALLGRPNSAGNMFTRIITHVYIVLNSILYH